MVNFWGRFNPFKRSNDARYPVNAVDIIATDSTPSSREKTNMKVLAVRLYENFKLSVMGRNYHLHLPDEKLKTLTNAIKTESLLRRARDRYTELIWKNGFDIVGMNPDAVSYVKQRLKEIAYVTQKPTIQFFEEMTNQLVLYFNCFIYKRRSKPSSSGNPYRYFSKTVQPVAGYFIVDCTKVRLCTDIDTGLVIDYEFESLVKNSYATVKVSYTDMIHMVLDRMPGNYFGEPAAYPVLDDIRALRRMEENVEILVFQYTIPLFQYAVGDKDDPCHEGEVDIVKAEIENMVAQGMLVTPHRHKIQAVGAERTALDVKDYLQYFKTRILTGMGHSSVSIGEGGGASRATASVLEQSVIDAAIKFQKNIKMYIDEFIINELLMEGGYDIFADENKVEIFLPEIDIDAKLRKEYHTMQLYQGGLLDENEARIDIGRKPVTDAQRPFMYLEVVTKPTLEFKNAIEADAAGGPGSAAAKEGAQRSVPSNQHGTKKVGRSQRTKDMIEPKDVVASDVATMIDAYSQQFKAHYLYAFEDVTEALRTKATTAMKLAINVSESLVLEQGGKYLIAAYQQGLAAAGTADNVPADADLRELHAIHSKNVKGFFADLEARLLASDMAELDVVNLFESQLYRIGFIADWHMKKAYWLAVASSLTAQDKEVNVKTTGCEKCKEFKGILDAQHLHVGAIPPFHAHCDCGIKI